MIYSPTTFAVAFHATGLVSKPLCRQFSVLLVCCALLLPGCAKTPAVTVQSQDIQTLQGLPVKVTRIDFSSGLTDAQVSEDSIWAVQHNGLFSKNHAQIDPTSYKIKEYPRPASATGINLLVDGHTLWFSNGISKLFGSGDLYSVDQESNQVVATIEAAGAPFAIGDGAVWAYNPHTQIVTGVDKESSQIRTQFAAPGVPFPFVTQGGSGGKAFTFAADSIWQFAYEGDFSDFRLNSCEAPGGTVLGNCKIPPGVVRRIDPNTQQVIAEITLGPYRPSDGLRFVAGAIWVLGWGPNESGNALATRINVETNRVDAKIQLSSRTCLGSTRLYNPRTPVLWDGGIWVSGVCTHEFGRVLLKIDQQTSQVIDEIALPNSSVPNTPYLLYDSTHPALVAGAGALWGFVDGRSILRFDF